MATILIAWELGGGLGHVSPLQGVVETLAQRGHRVVLALRQVTAATMLFRHPRIRVVQAPILTHKVQRPLGVQTTFAHILHNVGLDNVEDLQARCAAWETLYELVDPDLVMFDHSPTALLASWRRNVARVCFGVGFVCPPACRQLPAWRKCPPRQAARLQRAERQVLRNINQLRHRWHQPEFRWLSQLYSSVDETVVTTFAELDHFRLPRHQDYWGTLPGLRGAPPAWPDRKGKRVFAYLKPARQLPEFLKALVRRGCPTLAFVPGIPADACSRYSTATLRVVNEPQDMQQVARDCDLAVSNGGHGMTAQMLLAGKAMLVLPQYLEQRITAQNLERLRAGLAATWNQPRLAMQRLVSLLDEPQLSSGAVAFAKKYKNHDPHASQRGLVDRIEKLAS